jgi:hypothetical protein
MRSKAHTTLTTPLVLRCTRLDKCAMKKFSINGHLRKKLFLIVIHRFSLVKAAMNALCVCKMRNGGQNALNFFFFLLPKCAMNILHSYLNCCTIINWKTRKRSNTVRALRGWGAGGFFKKTFRTSLFNEDLLTEPNFSRIHLAGQYI